MNAEHSEPPRPNNLILALRATFLSWFFWLTLFLWLLVSLGMNAHLPAEHAVTINGWSIASFAVGWLIRSTKP